MAVTAKQPKPKATLLVRVEKQTATVAQTVNAVPTVLAVRTVAVKIVLAAAEAKNNIIQTHGCTIVQSCVCF